MTAIICLLIALAMVALAFVAYVVAIDQGRTEKLRQALDDRARDIDTYRESVMELTSNFADSARDLAARDSDERRLVMDALIGDRQRLVTAVLASSSSISPNAAALLARADQANARGQRAMNARDLFDEAQTERVLGGVVGDRERQATEYEDERGEPIVPVGL